MRDSRITPDPQDRPKARKAGGSAAQGSSPWDPAAWATVRLLDVDPDLAPGLSDAERATVTHFEVRSLHVPPGPWSPPPALEGALGMIVLSGQLIRTGRTFARTDVQLLGAGDVGECRVLSDSHGEWRALETAQLAVLDDRFIVAARRWPALMSGLARRLFEAQQEQHIRCAICAMPRVEERILALLCHLAGRWGHVTASGVTLTLPVTHEVLGALIGARRPTVTLALIALAQRQLLLRQPDGTWLLPADSVRWPATGVPSGPRELAA
jgi:CRP/FNR family cyclic AMP-dependent transcriptional regulator